jgi:hypothetical protein
VPQVEAVVGLNVKCRWAASGARANRHSAGPYRQVLTLGAAVEGDHAQKPQPAQQGHHGGDDCQYQADRATYDLDDDHGAVPV